LKEVRWDLFEEAISSYIKNYLVFKSDKISIVNWHSFIKELKIQISDENSSGDLENVDVVQKPCNEIREKYLGPVVRLSTLLNFCQT
jgi:hypothetical protein